VRRRISFSALALVLLVAGIVMVPLLRSGRVLSTGSLFQSSLLPTPGSPTPPADSTPPPPTTVYPPTVPPATVVFPTPPTPIPGAPLITEEQAIAIALSQNPYFRERLQRGELAVTSKLTIHGDAQAGTTGDLTVHPELPVWLVYLHVQPWTQMEGPVGAQIEVQYNLIWYELDASTGKLLGGGRSYSSEIPTATATLEAVP
jgi:hypothetical protein